MDTEYEAELTKELDLLEELAVRQRQGEWIQTQFPEGATFAKSEATSQITLEIAKLLLKQRTRILRKIREIRGDFGKDEFPRGYQPIDIGHERTPCAPKGGTGRS
jgi:hypothetical protein